MRSVLCTLLAVAAFISNPTSGQMKLPKFHVKASTKFNALAHLSTPKCRRHFALTINRISTPTLLSLAWCSTLPFHDLSRYKAGWTNGPEHVSFSVGCHATSTSPCPRAYLSIHREYLPVIVGPSRRLVNCVCMPRYDLSSKPVSRTSVKDIDPWDTPSTTCFQTLSLYS